MQAIRKSWRDSSSLIMLARRVAAAAGAASREAGQECVNYDILLQTRTHSASFPNSVVFPGGVSEPADDADRWLALLASFGYSQTDFQALHCSTTTTPIFQDDPVHRHISLRITAIRETFEELGLLLCNRDHKKDRASDCASILTDIDVKHWQPRVSKDPAELFNLCEQHNCYPDIWSLYYWSNWLSPVHLPKRFSTAFFITSLADKPAELESNDEVTNVQWSSPLEVLQNRELTVYPPQAYEFNRLACIPDIEEITKFAKQRSGYSEDLMFPVALKARDGEILLLPGDDLYPSNVDYYKAEVKSIDKTIADLRQETDVVHRFELTEPRQFVFKNYKPAKHIYMGDRAIQSYVVVH